MKEYICTVCGYVHKTDGELPDDFKCPLCGAGKDAFVLKEDTTKIETALEKPHTEKELSPMEMSIICSNLARGCEKQYMSEESKNFKKLAEFFKSKAENNRGFSLIILKTPYFPPKHLCIKVYIEVLICQ